MVYLITQHLLSDLFKSYIDFLFKSDLHSKMEVLQPLYRVQNGISPSSPPFPLHEVQSALLRVESSFRITENCQFDSGEQL